MDIENALVVAPEIPKSVDKACENLTAKPTEEIGNTFADLWYLVFGGLSERAEKKRLKVAQNIEEYKKELCAATAAIPEERLQEPKLQIAGPALQKSQYCVEEKELREMFVKLISRSMDKTYNSKIHPSFPEIISQMSPLDAENLMLIGSGYKQVPVARYALDLVKEGHKMVKTLVFLSNPKVTDIDIQAASLSALSRTGLISITFDEWSADVNEYDVFEKHPFFIYLKNLVPPVPEGGYQSPRDDKMIKKASITRGLIRITPLGSDFLSACLSEQIEVYPKE